MPQCGPKATIQEVNDIIYVIKNSIAENKFRFINSRKKNMETLGRLGFVTRNVLEIILDLTYKNYLNGPSDDRDIRSDVDTIWEFGYILNDDFLYIKIKVKNSDDVIGISFHLAERPLLFHYAGT